MYHYANKTVYAQQSFSDSYVSKANFKCGSTVISLKLAK